jgi:Tfp pilus assembly protein PilF
MAYLESGDINKAKEYLSECLKLDPNNVSIYVLLGNVYTKHEHNFDVAEFYYQKGLSINPQDNLLLNNYAVLKIEQCKLQEAKELFEQALIADPAFPNTYYGLALLHKIEGNPELALNALDQLYNEPKSQDIRSAPVYKQASSLYLELNKLLPGKTYQE